MYFHNIGANMKMHMSFKILRLIINKRDTTFIKANFTEKELVIHAKKFCMLQNVYSDTIKRNIFYVINEITLS